MSRALAMIDAEPVAAERQVYLHPGHLFFTREPAIVSTVLGSCVSICLFAPEAGAGGINHYLLPEHLGLESPRFGSAANQMLLGHFLSTGIPVSSLKAKVFGGSAIAVSHPDDLPSRNIAAALAFLERHGIPIVSRDVGGRRGRKLIFRTSDGAAWVRQL